MTGTLPAARGVDRAGRPPSAALGGRHRDRADRDHRHRRAHPAARLGRRPDPDHRGRSRRDLVPGHGAADRAPRPADRSRARRGDGEERGPTADVEPAKRGDGHCRDGGDGRGSADRSRPRSTSTATGPVPGPVDRRRFLRFAGLGALAAAAAGLLSRWVPSTAEVEANRASVVLPTVTDSQPPLVSGSAAAGASGTTVASGTSPAGTSGVSSSPSTTAAGSSTGSSAGSSAARRQARRDHQWPGRAGGCRPGGPRHHPLCDLQRRLLPGGHGIHGSPGHDRRVAAEDPRAGGRRRSRSATRICWRCHRSNGWSR